MKRVGLAGDFCVCDARNAMVRRGRYDMNVAAATFSMGRLMRVLVCIVCVTLAPVSSGFNTVDDASAANELDRPSEFYVFFFLFCCEKM